MHWISAGIKNARIEEVTGFPEMMDGRVKTLHPKNPWWSFRKTRVSLATWRQWRRKISTNRLCLCQFISFQRNDYETRCRNSRKLLKTLISGGPSMLRSAAKP